MPLGDASSPDVNARGNSCLHRECLAANLLALLQSVMAAGSFFVILVCTPIISGLARVAALISHQPVWVIKVSCLNDPSLSSF